MDAFSSTDQLQELDHENPVKQQKKNSMIARRYSLSPKARAYKNILGGGFSFMLIISSVLALLGLQSSLNDEEGLGLATLAIASTTFLISGVFTSSFIRALGTKYASLAAYAMSFVYLISNFYPSWYTLVPGAICYGLALGPIFASVNIHATVTAIRYASDLREDVNDLIAFFNGIVTMFYKVAFLPGNLATTIILFSERANSGNSIIQSQASLGSVCNGTDAQDLDEKYIYVLLSCFVVVVTIAIAIAFFFVDNPPRTKLHFQSCGRTMKIYVKDPIAATLKMLLNWSIILLLPNAILNAFLTSSTLGILAKVYVSDCIGVHWVGLFTLTYGTCSGLSAVITGRLVKFIPQFLIVYTASIVMLGILLFLLFWEIQPSYLVAFLPIGVLGACEGVWFNIPPTLVGILFPQHKEPAYATIRMGLAVGYIIGFLVPLFASVNINLWIGLSLLLISVTTYSVLYLKTQHTAMMSKSVHYAMLFMDLYNGGFLKRSTVLHTYTT